MRRLAAALCAALCAAAPAFAQDEAPRPELGAPRGEALSGAALDEEAVRISGLLRCPVCQGLSVADSPVELAQNMRKEVRDLLVRGYDEEQILAYFEGAYGEFVRLEPKLVGVNWLVWLAPLAGLLAGAVVVGWTLRRTPPRPVPEPSALGKGDAASRDRLPEDPALAKYLTRVRELSYGWRGGRAPVPGSVDAPAAEGDSDGAG